VDQHFDIDDELKNKLVSETSKIKWGELQTFYASGAVIAVNKGNDLIHVAAQFSLDNKKAVSDWLEAGEVFKVEDKQAAQWQQQETILWAVVIAPWVLVQEV
jgi:hypothetical protein